MSCRRLGAVAPGSFSSRRVNDLSRSGEARCGPLLPHSFSSVSAVSGASACRRCALLVRVMHGRTWKLVQVTLMRCRARQRARGSRLRSESKCLPEMAMRVRASARRPSSVLTCKAHVNSRI